MKNFSVKSFFKNIILFVSIILCCSCFSLWHQIKDYHLITMNSWKEFDKNLQDRYYFIPILIKTIKAEDSISIDLYSKLNEVRSNYIFSTNELERISYIDFIESGINKLLQLEYVFSNLSNNQSYLKIKNIFRNPDPIFSFKLNQYNNNVLFYNKFINKSFFHRYFSHLIGLEMYPLIHFHHSKDQENYVIF